jgi:hypothetical protein
MQTTLVTVCADEPATKTVLLHMEDFKIAENLSRFAVKCGMWGYIKQMSPHLTQFVADRRARGIDPNSSDPQAFGTPDVAAASHSTLRPSASDASLAQMKNRRRLRRVASAVVAGSMLLALGATANGPENNCRRRCRRSPSSGRRASDEEENS